MRLLQAVSSLRVEPYPCGDWHKAGSMYYNPFYNRVHHHSDCWHEYYNSYCERHDKFHHKKHKYKKPKKHHKRHCRHYDDDDDDDGDDD